jgi:hypothetical protein
VEVSRKTRQDQNGHGKQAIQPDFRVFSKVFVKEKSSGNDLLLQI